MLILQLACVLHVELPHLAVADVGENPNRGQIDDSCCRESDRPSAQGANLIRGRKFRGGQARKD
jgi:hypothetical protein